MTIGSKAGLSLRLTDTNAALTERYRVDVVRAAHDGVRREDVSALLILFRSASSYLSDWPTPVFYI